MAGREDHKRSFSDMNSDDSSTVLMEKVQVDALYGRIAEQAYVIANLRYDATKNDKIYKDLVEHKDDIIRDTVTSAVMQLQKFAGNQAAAMTEMKLKAISYENYFKSYAKRFNLIAHKLVRTSSSNKFLEHSNEDKDHRIVKLENDIKTLTHKKTKKKISTSSSLNIQ